jgi:LysM domain-containing protein
MSSLTISAPVRRSAAGRPVRREASRPARGPATTGASPRPTRLTRRVRPTRPVRLTRRGRVVVALVLLTVIAAAFLVLRAPATASTGEPAAPVARTVTVEPGQTLWQVAREVRPQADPRETIARIMEMNGLTSASVQAGRQIYVPAG